MDNLENELHRLSQINPPEAFLKASKARLMAQINLNPLNPNESWFAAFLRERGSFDPSSSFISQARMRLMAQIKTLPQPVKIPLQGLAYLLNFLKKALASTLVMVIAVTAVLFQIEGNTIVEASNDSYLQVISGTVSLKRADLLTWEDVKNQTKLQAGDLIQVKKGSQAVLRFFDDTEVRLDENTTFLVSQLAFSSAFTAQGVIAASLQEGQAWVQTLNIEDGYAGFTLDTREAVLKTLNGAFTVKSTPRESTEVAVFDGTLNVSAFSPESGKLFNKTQLTPQKAVLLTLDDQNIPHLEESELTNETEKDKWVKSNLQKDEQHLAELREKGYDRLTLMAGTLPGDMLYSVKQAKESLRLAWTGDEDSSVKIEIANNRLNEAIVLFGKGKIKEGREALEAYQKQAQEILASTKKSEESDKLITELVLPHQKLLASQPTTKNSLVVKETLQHTAEILAQSPLELENIKLKNSVSDLKDVMALINTGDLKLAKEKLSEHTASENQIPLLQGLADGDEKKEAFQEVLDLKQQERDLLALVSEKTTSLNADQGLVAMVASTSEKINTQVDEIRAAALPIMPELAQQIEAEKNAQSTSTPLPPVLSEAEQLAARINIYTSWEGQLSQIERLLAEDLEDVTKIDFLQEVQKYLTGRAHDYLSIRILQLQNKLKAEVVPEIPVVQPVPEGSANPTETPKTDPTTVTTDPTISR